MSAALHLQHALRSGTTFESLLSAYGVTAKRHGAIPNLVLFKYDQIASPFGEPIVRESRGIILDAEDNWRVVSRSFDKFFNHGEGHAAEIDWSSARVQEKCDGSLITAYHYSGAWHVATTGTADAGGRVNNGDRTFAKYFRDTIGGEPFSEAPKDLCFLFELMGPDNRIVVVHPEPRVVLLAVRNRVTGAYEDERTWAPILGVPAVQSYPLSSFAEITASFAAISPLSQEGYVVVDERGSRVKVKHPGYVALHHAKDGLGPKAFLEIARSGEVSEVLAAFPEFAPLLEAARVKVDALVADIETAYAPIASISAQKEFALHAVKNRFSAALFAIRAKKSRDARHFVKEMRIDALAEWVAA